MAGRAAAIVGGRMVRIVARVRITAARPGLAVRHGVAVFGAVLVATFGRVRVDAIGPVMVEAAAVVVARLVFRIVVVTVVRRVLPFAIGIEALDSLGAYHWPENVAELSMVLEHAVLAASGRARVELSDLPRKFRGSAEVVAGEPPEWPSLVEVEQQWIVRTLQRCGGSRALAASALGIHPNTLGRKLREYGIGRTRAAQGARGHG